MGTTYQKAEQETLDLLDEVMGMYHTQLRDAGVSVDVLLAYSDGEGPAVKAHGYAAAAVVRIVNLKDRVKGCGDAEIVLDGDRIDEWSVREIKAIFDHELTHLELLIDMKTGKIKRDDLGRPKLTMRLHDRQFGWFDQVARRWGDDAVEVQQAIAMVGDWEFTQMYLPGFTADRLGRIRKESLAESLAADLRASGVTSVEFRSAGAMAGAH